MHFVTRLYKVSIFGFVDEQNESSKRSLIMVGQKVGPITYMNYCAISTVDANRPLPLLEWQVTVDEELSDSQILKRAVRESWGHFMLQRVAKAQRLGWLIPLPSKIQGQLVFAMRLTWDDILEKIRVTMKCGGPCWITRGALSKTEKRLKDFKKQMRKKKPATIIFSDMQPDHVELAIKAYKLMDEKMKKTVKHPPRVTYSKSK